MSSSDPWCSRQTSLSDQSSTVYQYRMGIHKDIQARGFVMVQEQLCDSGFQLWPEVEMTFKDFSTLNSGGYFVRWSGTI